MICIQIYIYICLLLDVWMLWHPLPPFLRTCKGKHAALVRCRIFCVLRRTRFGKPHECSHPICWHSEKVFSFSKRSNTFSVCCPYQVSENSTMGGRGLPVENDDSTQTAMHWLKESLKGTRSNCPILGVANLSNISLKMV